ncbi:MAG TPA: hypothetical protein VL986_07635 [Terracidiphilus sp.]|nr:hypothetical protein [Terracidiphilus sp.]
MSQTAASARAYNSRMVKMKLLTVAAILAIIACGACFLPPIMDRQPTAPPPPRPPKLTGISTVRVFVIDNSIPADIDTAAAAAEVVQSINHSGSKAITAHAGGEPGDADLNIAINNDAATLFRVWPSDRTESWSFTFNISELLIRTDGRTLWRRVDFPVGVTRVLLPNHAEDVWKESDVMNDCVQSLSIKATEGIFF